MHISSSLENHPFICVSIGKVEKTELITNMIGDTENNKIKLKMSVCFLYIILSKNKKLKTIIITKEFEQFSFLFLQQLKVPIVARH